MAAATDTIRAYAGKLRLIVYRFLSVQLRLSAPKKRILVIKKDAIGDYVIFRNFLGEINNSDKFSDHELYVLSSSRLAGIIKDLDKDIVKEVIVFPPDTMGSVEREISFYKRLNAYRFSHVIHPTYSPDSASQHLVSFINAPVRIGFSGDTTNQTETDKVNFEKFYTRLIVTQDPFQHEFERNAFFFRAVLEKEIPFQKPFINVSPGSVTKSVLICPAAQQQFRAWSLEKFARLVTEMSAALAGYEFVVATGPGEDRLYSEISAASSVSMSHYKIRSILDFAKLVSRSSLVVCNDSSAAHIAVACGTYSICISNGNHYGRFIPYPDAMEARQSVVLPPELAGLTETERRRRYYGGSSLNIDEISVNSVLLACRNHMT